jgi:Glycosyl hydrolases family 35
MRRLTRLILLAAVFIGVCPIPSQAADAPLPPRVFSHPDRIRYDSQCFTIEGKDTFIFSGAFHYFRCPKELWSDRFDKIKAAGFNTVETYVAWNAAEPTMPASVDDYSKVDLKDLDDWLTMAEARGLYVILRPGPYICAEWDCGGFPQWLLTKRPVDYKGLWLRSDEPTFVAWSNHWFHAVDQIAVKHQLTHRAPGSFGIILYQLENEYGQHQPYDVEVRYLHALGKQAMDDGIDVPLFTCWTEVVRGNTDPILRQVYDTVNLYPRFKVDSIADKIAELQKQQPDAPLQTTELQGGWFTRPGDDNSMSKSWTDVVDSLSPAQIQNLTLYAIEKGDRVMNYYMLAGGTNFGDLAPQGITTSYDYSAPIREIGSVGEKYQRVAAIGAMLKEHGDLARTTEMLCDFKTDQKDVTVAGRRSDDGNIYFFVRTNQHAEARKGHVEISYHFSARNGSSVETSEVIQKFQVDYDLEPFGSKIFYIPASKTNFPGAQVTLETEIKKAEWLPNLIAATKRPTDGLPTTIKLTQALTKSDPGPAQWQQLKDGQTLEQMGIYDRRFVFYRTHLNNGGDKAIHAPPLLSILAPSRDHLLSFVNGQFEPDIVQAGKSRPGLIHGGDYTIEMLYENVGQRVGGAGMEEMAGIRKIETLATPNSKPAELPVEIGTESTGFAGQWWKSDLDETGWKNQGIDQPTDSAAGLNWSRLKFELPEVKKGIWVPWVARLTTTGNGFLYLNGHALGRYWQVGPQHDFFLPECWMNCGPGKTNVLTMCLRSVDGKPVAITSAEIVPVNEVAEFRP